MGNFVKCEIEGKIAVVTIDRPPVNALNYDVITQLGEVADQLAQNQEIGAVIITGAGNKAFVAGADISEIAELDQTGGLNLSLRGQAVFNKIANLPVPVIAAVNGFALGGGCELSLACDIRVVAANAKMGVPEVSLGIIPGYGGTQRLPRVLATGKAKELIFTGDMINAEEAYRIGLADRLTPEGQSVEEAKNWLRLFWQKDRWRYVLPRKQLIKALSVLCNRVCLLKPRFLGKYVIPLTRMKGPKHFWKKGKQTLLVSKSLIIF